MHLKVNFAPIGRSTLLFTALEYVQFCFTFQSLPLFQNEMEIEQFSQVTEACDIGADLFPDADVVRQVAAPTTHDINGRSLAEWTGNRQVSHVRNLNIYLAIQRVPSGCRPGLG